MRIVIILIAWRKARNVLALGSPDLCPQLRLRPASMTANFDDAVKPRKTPLPHLNVACNSPTTLSNFESTSLKFRGFSTSPICLTTELHAKLGGASEEPRGAPGTALLKPSTPPAQPLSHPHRGPGPRPHASVSRAHMNCYQRF